MQDQAPMALMSPVDTTSSKKSSLPGETASQNQIQTNAPSNQDDGASHCDSDIAASCISNTTDDATVDSTDVSTSAPTNDIDS